ncbi:MAG: hypothetical protein AB8B50_19650, partial [Pirellulaceae bacterium]
MSDSNRSVSKTKNLLRRLLIAGLVTGSVSAPAMGQEYPPLPTQSAIQTPAAAIDLSQPVVKPAPQAKDSSVRVYNVPSNLVGAVAAQLQMRFRSDASVSVTTEPSTGQLMVMAPSAVHRQLGAEVAELLQAVEETGLDRGPNIASTQQRSYVLRNLSWRELE